MRLDVTPCPALPGALARQESWLVVHGLHALPVTRMEAGTHLFCPTHAATEPVRVESLPLEGELPADAILDQRRADRLVWLDELEKAGTTAAEDPDRSGPVIRIYHEESVIDFRRGNFGQKAPLHEYLLDALPLPAELIEED